MSSSTTTSQPLEVVFDDGAYRVAHGKAPRGRGSWAFAEDRNVDASSDAVLWAPPYLTLTQAKAWARREVARRGGQGYVRLWVLS